MEVPFIQVEPLQKAAAELAGFTAPTPPEKVESLLMALRRSTIVNNEDVSEAEVSFRVLVSHLRSIPVDILQLSLSRFIDTPDLRTGKVFFPKSPAEILGIARPLLSARLRAIHRLNELARLGKEQEHERQRMALTETIPDAEVFGWSPSMVATAFNKGWITQEQVDRIGIAPVIVETLPPDG